MLPIGLALRAAGHPVNVYGELVVQTVLGQVYPWALLVEHSLISWSLAWPLVWLLRYRPQTSSFGLGLAYGAAIWVVVNSLALPAVFGRPTPWQMGWPAIWPSLTVHLVYGVMAALVARRLHPSTAVRE